MEKEIANLINDASMSHGMMPSDAAFAVTKTEGAWRNGFTIPTRPAGEAAGDAEAAEKH